MQSVYDLKGSLRNRLVDTEGKQNIDTVLLDENLLKRKYKYLSYPLLSSK